MKTWLDIIFIVILPAAAIACGVVMAGATYQRIKEIHEKLFPEQYSKKAHPVKDEPVNDL